jgi:large subunit ribosomal protein L3
MGAKSVTTPNIRVVKVDTALGVLLVKGPVPGPAKGLVHIRDALRKPTPATVAS